MTRRPCPRTSGVYCLSCMFLLVLVFSKPKDDNKTEDDDLVVYFVANTRLSGPTCEKCMCINKGERKGGRGQCVRGFSYTQLVPASPLITLQRSDMDESGVSFICRFLTLFAVSVARQVFCFSK